jgi:hypothetical protein
MNKMLLILLFLPLFGEAQVVDYGEKRGLDRKLLYKGDTVLVSIDNAVIMNVETYSMYKMSASLLDSLKISLKQYDKLIDEKERLFHKKVEQQDSLYNLQVFYNKRLDKKVGEINGILDDCLSNNENCLNKRLKCEEKKKLYRLGFFSSTAVVILQFFIIVLL